MSGAVDGFRSGFLDRHLLTSTFTFTLSKCGRGRVVTPPQCVTSARLRCSPAPVLTQKARGALNPTGPGDDPASSLRRPKPPGESPAQRYPDCVLGDPGHRTQLSRAQTPPHGNRDMMNVRCLPLLTLWSFDTQRRPLKRSGHSTPCSHPQGPPSHSE